MMPRFLGASLLIVAAVVLRNVEAFISFTATTRLARPSLTKLASSDDQLRDLYEKAKKEDSEWLKQVLGDEDFGLVSRKGSDQKRSENTNTSQIEVEVEVEGVVSDKRFSDLGYDLSDIKQIKSSVLEIILEQGIRRPRRGFPQSWLRYAPEVTTTSTSSRPTRQSSQSSSSTNKRSTYAYEAREGQYSDGEEEYSSSRQLVRPDRLQTPAVRRRTLDLDDEDDYDFIEEEDTSRIPELDSRREPAARQRNRAADRGESSSRGDRSRPSNKDAEPDQRKRKSSQFAEAIAPDYSYTSLGKEKGEAFAWAGVPPSYDEIEESREVLKDERARRRAGVTSTGREFETGDGNRDVGEDYDEEGPSPFWPDASEFKGMLIDESQWRVNLIGDWSVPFIKEETKWRYKLYKNWLQFLDDGLGDGFDVVDEEFYDEDYDGDDGEYYDDEYSEEEYDTNYRGDRVINSGARDPAAATPVKSSSRDAAPGTDVGTSRTSASSGTRDDENNSEDRPRRVSARERPPRNRAEAYDRWVREKVSSGQDWTDVEKEERTASRVMQKDRSIVDSGSRGSNSGSVRRRRSDARSWDFGDEAGYYDRRGDADDDVDQYYRDEDDAYRATARRSRLDAAAETAATGVQRGRMVDEDGGDDGRIIRPITRPVQGFYDGLEQELEDEDEADERMFRKRYSGRESSNENFFVEGNKQRQENQEEEELPPRRRTASRAPASSSSAAAARGVGGRFVMNPQAQYRSAAEAGEAARSARKRRISAYERDNEMGDSNLMSPDEAFREAWIASAERRPIGDADRIPRSSSSSTGTAKTSKSSLVEVPATEGQEDLREDSKRPPSSSPPPAAAAVLVVETSSEVLQGKDVENTDEA